MALHRQAVAADVYGCNWKSVMQSAYTVLILLMLVGVSRLIGRLIPLPLPLVQIGAGALLAWPSLGLQCGA